MLQVPVTPPLKVLSNTLKIKKDVVAIRSGTLFYSSNVVQLILNRSIGLPKCTIIRLYLLCQCVA